MADTKITALAAIGANPINVATFPIPMVDLLDTSMAASGTTKKVTVNQILGAGGTATLASATITGDLTVDTNVLKVDTTNNRVGIGTASPAYNLDVIGSASIGGTGSAFTRFTSNGGITTLGVGAYVSVQGSGNPATGSGLEINGGATPFILAYNRDGSAYLPLTIDGSSVLFKTSGSEKARIDATGNLGIGVTPSAWTVPTAEFPAVYAIGQVGISQNAFYQSAWKYKTTGLAALYQFDSGVHKWYTAPSGTAGNAISFTQAMTLDASGNLLVGQTNAALDAQGGFWLRNAAASGGSSLIVNHRTGVISANSYAEFTYNGVGIGSITQNGTTGVLYNINSDYRLKESVAPLSGGLARVSALKPSIYKWKSDGSSGEGFLAHELAEVVPFAVTGEKDAVNEDGSIKSQGIDMSRIVPILVAAIQELATEVNALKKA